MTGEQRTILVTGAAGYIGRQLVQRLARSNEPYRMIAVDVREVSPSEQIAGVVYRQGDVRDPILVEWVREERVDTLVHLASIVNPGGPARREFERSVDVDGTENVIQACIAGDVKQLVITSSGASYGYHPDNPIPLRETDPLRGNKEFAYADHKRQIEESLSRYRVSHPELGQLILRPGTILGAHTDNSITRLFAGPVILGIAGFDTPFVFIWDDDVVSIIHLGIQRRATGIFNLAGDGTLTLRQIARLIGKPYLPIPLSVFRLLLSVRQRLRMSSFGPEQLIFLQYRPVLANDRLKNEFGYQPKMTSRQAFEHYWSHRGGSAHGRP